MLHLQNSTSFACIALGGCSAHWRCTNAGMQTCLQTIILGRVLFRSTITGERCSQLICIEQTQCLHHIESKQSPGCASCAGLGVLRGWSFMGVGRHEPELCLIRMHDTDAKLLEIMSCCAVLHSSADLTALLKLIANLYPHEQSIWSYQWSDPLGRRLTFTCSIQCMTKSSMMAHDIAQPCYGCLCICATMVYFWFQNQISIWRSPNSYQKLQPTRLCDTCRQALSNLLYWIEKLKEIPLRPAMLSDDVVTS